MPRKQTSTAEPKKRSTPAGVYLRQEIRTAIEEIAAAEGVTVHSVMQFGIAYFVKQYKSGKVKLKTEERPKRVKID